MTDKRVRIMVVNAQAASASDTHTERVVNKAFMEADKHNVDVILWSEVGDVYIPSIGQSHARSWDSTQYGAPKKDESVAGLAISWDKNRVSLTSFSREQGSAATSEGKWKTGSGIRQRSIINCRITDPFEAPLHAVHPPPKRALRARLSYMRKALRKAGIIGGDTNFIRVVLAKLDPRRNVTSVGLLALIAPKRFWVSNPTKVDVGSDHRAFFVDVEPKKPRARRLRMKRKKR